MRTSLQAAHSCAFSLLLRSNKRLSELKRTENCDRRETSPHGDSDAAQTAAFEYHSSQSMRAQKIIISVRSGMTGDRISTQQF